MSGDYSKLSDDAVGDAFLIENISLVPNTTNVYTLHINPRFIDWRNGAGFEIVVPELSVADVSGDSSGTEDDSGSDTSGDGESGGENPITVLPSSGGGCETGVGILAAVILAGALIFRKTESR